MQIVESIDDVKLTILIAFALVVLVVFLFLGRVRETVVPVIALPLALLGTFAVMLVLGYSLDNLSLMALTLAVRRCWWTTPWWCWKIPFGTSMPASPPPLPRCSAQKEISFTVLSMTLSLSAIFIPDYFHAAASSAACSTKWPSPSSWPSSSRA